jgi:23S rRNA (adenine2503-C2)-methyltransferase
VNCIPDIGDRPASGFSGETMCERFQMALKAQKIVTTLRREKGHDIDAACGQLRLKTERELAASAGTQ